MCRNKYQHENSRTFHFYRLYRYFYYNVAMTYKKEIIAVLDPMCSWCWGFEPVLQALKTKLPVDTKLSLCLGGLRSANDEVWNDRFKAYLQEHWEHVQEHTGQKFNTDLFTKENFDYNTEPSCRAVISFDHLNSLNTFDFMYALQKAFYLESKDITQTDVLAKIAQENGVNRDEFIRVFSSDKMKEATLADKYKARSMGASSFPSLVFIDEEGHLYVLKGYRSLEEISKHL